MSVSKKHMEWAAQYVRSLPVPEQHDTEKRQAVIDAFSSLFEAFNPRFDVDRFERAATGVYFTLCPECDDQDECAVISDGAKWLNLKCGNGHSFKEAK